MSQHYKSKEIPYPSEWIYSISFLLSAQKLIYEASRYQLTKKEKELLNKSFRNLSCLIKTLDKRVQKIGNSPETPKMEDIL